MTLSKDAIRLLFENSSDAYFLFTETGTIDCNQSALTQLGCSREQILSKHPCFFSPELQPSGERTEDFRRRMDELAGKQGYHRFESTIRRLDGTHLLVEATLTHIEVDGKPSMILIAHDLTEIRRVQSALTENRRLLHGVLQNSLDGVIAYEAIRDPAGKIVDFRFKLLNPAAEHLLNSQAADVIGKTLVELYPHLRADELFQRFTTIVETDTTMDFEYYSTRSDLPRWYRIAGAKLADGLAVSYTEITARKQIEKDLQASKEKAEAADRAKSSFLAMISHELRTPMNGVIGFANLLFETHLDAMQRDYAETIKQSGNTLLGLINDLLDFSKLETGKIELETTAFDLRTCVQDTVVLLGPEAQKKGLILEKHVAPDVPNQIFGDPTRLRQVLVNLLSNAIKFTSVGRIDLHLALAPDVDTKKSTLLFEVRDTGIGMSPEVVSRLFKPFVQGDSTSTRRFGGTGLGLAISRGLIESMRGHIEVASTPGSGTVFHVSLPCEPAKIARSTARLPVPAEKDLAEVKPSLFAETHPLRILVAEDNSVNMRVVLLLLQRLGYRADPVANGLECLQALDHLPYDVILMDVQMPEMDGLECTRKIRAAGSPIHIIALTADALSNSRDRCAEAGMDHYITKPLVPSHLQTALEVAYKKLYAKNIG